MNRSAHRAGDPRAAAARADGLPGDSLARLRICARAGALPARRAGTRAGGDRAGRGDGAARSPAAVRDTTRASASAQHRRKTDEATTMPGHDRHRLAGNRADHPRALAHDGADLGCRPGQTYWRSPAASSARKHRLPILPTRAHRASSAPGSGSSAARCNRCMRACCEQPSEEFSDERSGRRHCCGQRTSKGRSPAS